MACLRWRLSRTSGVTEVTRQLYGVRERLTGPLGFGTSGTGVASGHHGRLELVGQPRVCRFEEASGGTDRLPGLSQLQVRAAGRSPAARPLPGGLGVVGALMALLPTVAVLVRLATALCVARSTGSLLSWTPSAPRHETARQTRPGPGQKYSALPFKLEVTTEPDRYCAATTNFAGTTTHNQRKYCSHGRWHSAPK